MKAVAFWLCVNGRGEVMFRSSNRVLVAGWHRIIGARVVPVFRKWVNEAFALTKKEREAIAWFAEYGDLQSEARRAEVLKGLLERLG